MICFALQNEADCYDVFAVGTSRVSGGYMMNMEFLGKNQLRLKVERNLTQFVKGENEKFIFDISQQQRYVKAATATAT